MILLFQKLTLTKAIAWAIASLTIVPLPVWTQPIPGPASPLTAANQQEPDFSGVGRPGRQTSGESRGNCPPMNTRLTALMPNSHWGTTVTEHPTFWVYVPYSDRETPVGEFVLQDENRNDLYRTSFSLPKTPGLVSFTIPPTQAPLEINKWYRWYFKLYCDVQQSSSPMFVQGWVQRLTLDPTLESQLKAAAPREDLVYASHQIWYDALAHLAKLRLTHPTDASLEADWNRLLKAKGVSLEISESEPIVGSVVISPHP